MTDLQNLQFIRLVSVQEAAEGHVSIIRQHKISAPIYRFLKILAFY